MSKVCIIPIVFILSAPEQLFFLLSVLYFCLTQIWWAKLLIQPEQSWQLSQSVNLLFILFILLAFIYNKCVIEWRSHVQQWRKLVSLEKPSKNNQWVNNHVILLAMNISGSEACWHLNMQICCFWRNVKYVLMADMHVCRLNFPKIEQFIPASVV